MRRTFLSLRLRSFHRQRWVVRTFAAALCCTLFNAYGAREARAADPPTIIDIGTSPLCTTLRESVVPVLVGLHANDALIDAGRRQLGQWSHDAWQEGGGNGFWTMDRLRVENVVSSLVRNFNAIDGILNDAKRFPHDKATTTAALHDRLQAVEDSQRQTLNDLYGPVDTSMMADMQTLPDRPIQMKSLSTSPVDASAVAPNKNAMYDPEMVGNWPAVTKLWASGPSSVVATIPASLETKQYQIAQTESEAAGTVDRAVDQCKKATVPQP